ncbi:MAG: Crp/Fnr family transcriptional regulator [Rhodoblastus sp.]|nr:Crp/Fnr family transcriptional regulator [Rhodoblastus sp.]
MTNSLIARLEQFVRLSEVEKESVTTKFRHRRNTPAGRDIIHELDHADGVVVIIDGFAAQFKVKDDGKRQIVGYFHPGDLLHFGALAADEAVFGVTAFAQTTTSAIEADSFLALTSSSQSLSRAFWHLAIEQLSIAREWIVELGLGSAAQRLAHLFCEQHYRLEEVGRVNDGAFNFPLSQRDLGDTIGMTHVHVNRTLQELRGDGLIAFDGVKLQILDLARLRRLAKFDPQYLQWRKAGREA